MKPNTDFWISALNLEKHTEGGWFREVYRAKGTIPEVSLPLGSEGQRCFSTSIYYLLHGEEFSSFHRLRSDELWHYYEGDSAVEIVLLTENGINRIWLGRKLMVGEMFQAVVPANTWIAASLVNKNGFALMGCTVSPGFDYQDFEQGNRVKLLKEFLCHEDVIIRYTKE